MIFMNVLNLGFRRKTYNPRMGFISWKKWFQTVGPPMHMQAIKLKWNVWSSLIFSQSVSYNFCLENESSKKAHKYIY